ncbi:MAG TPA: hypothetical protein VK324_07470, partial [Tepidisphaeraceae bacterium]|nr:hypothetical protein [Tepidisphaeraceae bacterium]
MGIVWCRTSARVGEMNKAIGLWGVLDFGLAGVSFSQEFSPLGFNWAGADAVGLGQLFAKGLGTMASTAPLLDPVLQLFAKADSGWEPVGLTSRRCHPAGIVEEGLAGAARVRQSVHFASDRTVVVRYEPVDGDELPPLAVAGVLRPGIARLSGRGLDDGMLLTLDLRVQSTFTDRTADVKLRLRVHCQGASAAGFVPQAFSALGVADAGREDRLHEASEAGYWLELPRRDAVEFHLSWDTRTDDVRPKVQIPTLAAA